MSSLDDAVNEAVPGSNFAKPLLIAVGALILGHMFGGSKEEPRRVLSLCRRPARSPAAAGFRARSAACSTPPTPARRHPRARRRDPLFPAGWARCWSSSAIPASAQQADSWVGTGQNHPITPEQINSVIGHGKLAEIAQAGRSQPRAIVAAARAGAADLVDKLTPGGQLPKAGLIVLEAKAASPRFPGRGDKRYSAAASPAGRRSGPLCPLRY